MQSQESEQSNFNCCVCLEPAEHEYNLVGFGCCTAKVCLQCKAKLTTCPQCRLKCPAQAGKCKICDLCKFTMISSSMMLMQVAVQMYDDITERIKTSRKTQTYDNLYANYCHEHQVELIVKLQSLGCKIAVTRGADFTDLHVDIGFDLCNLCGWYTNLDTQCFCEPRRTYETNTYETNGFRILGRDDQEDEDAPALSIPDVKFSDVAYNRFR